MTNEISYDGKFKVHSGVHMRDEDFGTLVVSSSCQTLCLNKDAIAILNFCKDGFSINEIAEKLKCNYNDEKNEIAAKISKVVFALLKLGVISLI